MQTSHNESQGGAEQESQLRARYGGALAHVARSARAGETAVGWLEAEQSDFVRFNHGRVRQCGTVERATIELRLIRGDRQAYHTATLCADPAADAQRIDGALAQLRAALDGAEPDPYVSFAPDTSTGTTVRAARRATIEQICDGVTGAAGGADLVGFYAGGPRARALASSTGHDHWHETCDWAFEYSVYVASPGGGSDKAVKSLVSGDDWSDASMRASVQTAVERSKVLGRASRRIEPGRYRCWLDPHAVSELVGMLSWGGFSARSHRSGQSPLSRLRAGGAGFDPRVHLAEDPGALAVPLFQADGFVRPPRVDLVSGGRYAGWLASPRSALEFGIEANQAPQHESPEALTMAAGELDEHESLAALGTGIAVTNLHYLNYSDREACRITGMTRFGTVWVENGEPVAPLDVMRFDDSLYTILGEALEAIGRQAHRVPDTGTYGARSFGASSVPGILVDGLAFTL